MTLRISMALFINVAIFVFLSFACLHSEAATYTVSPGQDVQQALDLLQPGDVLRIHSGVYEGPLSLPVDGLPQAPITVRAYGDGEVLIRSSETVMHIDKKYWVFEGLTFDHDNGSSDAIKVYSSAEGVTIRSCEIRNGQRDGIDGRGSDITIENSVIHDFWWTGGDAHCIVLNPASGSHPAATGWRIADNRIYNCGGDGVQLYAGSSTPMEDVVREIEITGNTFYTTDGSRSENAIDCKGVVNGAFLNNEMYGFTGNKALVVQKGSLNLLVEGNKVHDSHRGMEFRGEDGKVHRYLTVRRNVIYNILSQYALKFDGVYDVEVIHNTIADNDAYAFLVEQEGITRGIFANNLVYLSGEPRIKGTFSSVDFSHNGWFATSAGSLESPTDTFGDDPGFMDPASGDFRLSPGSPAVDRGRDLGQPYYGTAPDLGAFEQQGDAHPVKGDINDDGAVDVLDLQIMVNMILGLREPTSSADLDGNGTVDVLDLQMLINLILS